MKKLIKDMRGQWTFNLIQLKVQNQLAKIN